MIRNVLAHPTLRSSFAFASAGVAFAIGNLVLARHMSVVGYGRFALALSLFNIFNALASGGLDLLLVRHDFTIDSRLLTRASISGAIVGAIAASTAASFYDLPFASAGLLAATLFGVGVGATAGGSLRSQGKTFLAFWITNLSSWTALAAGLLGYAYAWRDESGPLLLMTVLSIVSASLGWTITRRQMPSARYQGRDRLPWLEAIPLLTLALSTSLGLQLERLIAPLTLDIVALAEFNVLASLVIFPFRTLAAAINLILLPNLRRAEGRAARIAIVRREMLAMVLVSVVASTGLLWLGPSLASILTGGNYPLARPLIAAGCVNGISKMIPILPYAIVMACGRAKDLSMVAALSWASIGLSLLGSILGSRWGLPGLVCGAAVGNLISQLPMAGIARRVMRSEGGDREIAGA